MGELLIIYGVLLLIVLVMQYFLYRSMTNTGYPVILINMALGIILSFMAYTSLPENFFGQRLLALSLGGLAIFAVLMTYLLGKNHLFVKGLLTVSLIGGFVILLL